MPPTTYTIEVINNNSDPTPYLLFCDVPTASDNIGKAWINIYTKTPGVGAKGGSTTISINDSTFAVCGMAAQELAPRVSVSTAQSTPVDIGAGKLGLVKMDIQDDGLIFIPPTAKSTVVGGYQMDCGTWTNAKYPQAFCGIGKIQPNTTQTKVIPTATWTAKSANSYKVYPKKIFYISTGSYKPGEIVDYADFGQVATVDFTGLDETYATVTQAKDGTYDPTTYSFGGMLKN